MDFHGSDVRSDGSFEKDSFVVEGGDLRRLHHANAHQNSHQLSPIGNIDRDFDAQDTDDHHGHPDAEKKALPIMGIAIVTLGLLAVEFEWSILYVFANPILRQLGTSHIWVGLAWCASPICIIFFQPVLGVLSDRCEHPWGRRKPFLAVAAVGALISMMLIPNARDISIALFPEPLQPNGAILVAMLGVMSLDLTNELVYYFLRALLVDVLPSYQSEQGNSTSSFMLSVGGLLGNFIASRDLLYYFPIMKSNVHISFFVGKILFISILCLKQTYIQEKPLRRKLNSKQVSVKQAIVEVFQFMRHPPQGLLHLCLVDFFAWTGLFGFFMYITEWMGETIFLGNPTDSDPLSQQKFEDGVREGASDLIITSVITFLVAPALPFIIKNLGLRSTYLYAHILQGLCLIMTMTVRTPFGL
eukprot:TRINITY_DN1374_c0_g2_i1.p1 TRINITY_DN1374_c0_g2~~TRINITY_DN1374_c0_g2_i1.p1  ORF type:complete len:415 (-),score=75.16 TRINITY_DN1374_c0_g2_i1:380-1624(-)